MTRRGTPPASPIDLADVLTAPTPAWLPGAHLQTLFPFLIRPRKLRPDETMIVDVGDRNAVRVELNRPAEVARGTLLLVHGLGGCADSSYMLRTARQSLAAGWTVARMNCRNCGGTETLSRTLYNAGQSEDVGHVLARLAAAGLGRPFALLGFSLGGNLALRHAGLAGEGCEADAVVALNPPLDLSRCSRVMERLANRPYVHYFVYGLCRLIKDVRRIRHVPGPDANWWSIGSLREFDRLFVAPDAGFASAEHYYAAASAGPTLAGIRRPTLILSARNDPMVPYESIADYHQVNPRIRFEHPRRGGHLGYWQPRRPRFLGAEAALSFLQSLSPG